MDRKKQETKRWRRSGNTDSKNYRKTCAWRQHWGRVRRSGIKMDKTRKQTKKHKHRCLLWTTRKRKSGKNKEIFEKLENQITQKLTENELIIGGDFNAKLEINKPTEKQEQSRNGKILQDLITKKGPRSHINKSRHRNMDKIWMEQ